MNIEKQRGKSMSKTEKQERDQRKRKLFEEYANFPVEDGTSSDLFRVYMDTYVYEEEILRKAIMMMNEVVHISMNIVVKYWSETTKKYTQYNRYNDLDVTKWTVRFVYQDITVTNEDDLTKIKFGYYENVDVYLPLVMSNKGYKEIFIDFLKENVTI